MERVQPGVKLKKEDGPVYKKNTVDSGETPEDGGNEEDVHTNKTTKKKNYVTVMTHLDDQSYDRNTDGSVQRCFQSFDARLVMV